MTIAALYLFLLITRILKKEKKIVLEVARTFIFTSDAQAEKSPS